MMWFALTVMAVRQIFSPECFLPASGRDKIHPGLTIFCTKDIDTSRRTGQPCGQSARKASLFLWCRHFQRVSQPPSTGTMAPFT